MMAATLLHKFSAPFYPRYDVLIGKGLLDSDEWLIPYLMGTETAVIISDKQVNHHYGDKLEALLERYLPCVRLVMPVGDINKTRATKAMLEDQMIAANVGRKAIIFALGGGVTCDMAGFIAATYMRGVRYVSIPTSVMAMADAAIGGKTAVNTEGGKNLVGAFHQPECVAIDCNTLNTLSPQLAREGLVEIIKHAILADRELFTSIEAKIDMIVEGEMVIDDWAEWIANSVAIKIRIASEDIEDTGHRHMLNLGHSFGHALEKVSEYSIRHGDAVAWGMQVATRIAEQWQYMPREDAQRIHAILKKITEVQGLNVPPTILNRDFEEAMRRDKKNVDNKLMIIVPSALGTTWKQPERDWLRPVAFSEVRELVA